MTNRPAESVTPERFVALTRHLRVNGKPVENMLWLLQQDRERAEKEMKQS